MSPVLCVCLCMHTPPHRYNTVDVSVAVSTEGGLITPIVFDADEKVGWVGGAFCEGVVCK